MLKGVADPALLATYDAERRPVGKFTVEQAYTRYVTRTATYLGATDYQPLVADLEIELGYVYRSAAVRRAGDDDGEGHDDPRRPAAVRVPGRRTCGSTATGAVLDARSVRAPLRPARR